MKTQFAPLQHKEAKEDKLKRMSILSVSIPDLDTVNDHKMSILYKKQQYGQTT